MKRCSKITLVTAAFVLVASPAGAAGPQPLINYFKPMPIVGKLSTTVWGAGAVGPRDPANGLEDNGASGGVPAGQETYFYWDGKIIYASDGKYHLYGVHWLHSIGFGPNYGGSTGWKVSIPISAVSDTPMGPYTYQGELYTKNAEGNNMGHNVTALITPSGASPYTVSVGEIVPGQMFNSSSPNGPWTLMGLTGYNNNGHTACGTGADDLHSNFAFTLGPDNKYWATSRTGCIMTSPQVLGTYTVQAPRVLPNLEGSDMNSEDECMWYSGGYFHIVYNYWDHQRAYHIMSKDGLTGWHTTGTGLAYEGTQTPPNSNSNWLRYTDGTVNHWHNMERPGVLVQNGHVTHFTFAVTDTDKNSTAVNSGGSKIIVVPFDGVQFDCDNGDQASCNELSSDGGTVPSSGSSDGGGSGASSGTGTTGSGSSSMSDAGATTGSSGGTTSGDGTSGGSAVTSGSTASGSSGDGSSGNGASGTGATGAANSGSSIGGSGTGGSMNGASGSVVGNSGDTTTGTQTSGSASGSNSAQTGSAPGEAASSTSSGQSGGCGVTAGRNESTPGLAWLGSIALAGAWIRRRRRVQFPQSN